MRGRTARGWCGASSARRRGSRSCRTGWRSRLCWTRRCRRTRAWPRSRRPGSRQGLGELAPEVYVELPASGEGLDDVAAAGYRAKVRCGGVSAPGVEQLASFVRACREQGVAFKATAGLHHAVAAEGRHGFLNLLAAVLFGDEEAALAERDESAFELDAGAFAWRGRSAGVEQIERARRESFLAFGSCDAREPADELRALGFLQ